MLWECPQQLQIHHPIIIAPTLQFPVLLQRCNICLQISLFANLNFSPPPEAYLFTGLCCTYHCYAALLTVLSFDSLARCPVSFGILPVPPLRDQDLTLIPALALYSTQQHSTYTRSGKGQRFPVAQKQHRKMINPLYPVQRDSHTTPSSLKKSLEKSPGSVCKSQKGDTLASAFPSGSVSCDCSIP